MIYKAVIKEIYKCPCGYEGDILLKIFGEEYKFYYQANEDFADSFLEIGKEIEADIFAVYGSAEPAENAKVFCEVSDGNVSLCGKIIEKRGSGCFYRIDCGKFVIDIEDDDCKIKKSDIKVGDYIKYNGSLKVYFPETEYSFEDMEN